MSSDVVATTIISISSGMPMASQKPLTCLWQSPWRIGDPLSDTIRPWATSCLEAKKL
ncbi:uncharacterized protein EURHEDRAFT_407811 [Aspergillus ruber CBS 135680]|uniref:Uncharacterized protein n=1 Tax=Aspergillus ruber (strain CBS 135680) TaxID=1388766 RepID=A0A017SSN1_ASPRC|nr:uncharacterized protein EURHEDRAFT_407811 [Aspergillus ruber CBS 135680]EYE99811.1 hypothetical protein EURHEDRAFT_407811 [Aspergillus ruber CBS 135680]